MKIACDFVSIENLDATIKVSKELRKHRLSLGKGEEVLQPCLTLWYAWIHMDTRLPDSKSKSAGSVYPCPLCPGRKPFDIRNGILDHL